MAHYGIAIENRPGAELANIKKSDEDKARSRAWKLKELAGLEMALKHYAPLLGARRERSPRARAVLEQNKSIPEQELKTVSAITNARLKRFRPRIRLFKRGSGIPLAREGKGIPANMVTSRGGANISTCATKIMNLAPRKTVAGIWAHELCHSLLSHELPKWKEELRYYDKDRPAGAEEPLNSYARSAPAEDMCETARYYFYYPNSLRRKRPERFVLFQKIVHRNIGDFEQAARFGGMEPTPDARRQDKFKSMSEEELQNERRWSTIRIKQKEVDKLDEIIAEFQKMLRNCGENANREKCDKNREFMERHVLKRSVTQTAIDRLVESEDTSNLV